MSAPGPVSARTLSRRELPLRLVLVLGGLTAVGPLSLTMYLPALPQLAEDLGSTDALAQLTMTACMVGLALGQLVVGPLSDRYGRRRPLLLGVAAYTTSSFLCALAPDMLLLIGLRLVQGMAGGAGIVIARAIVRDRFDTDSVARVFALLLLVTGVAPVTAPVLGGQLVRVTSWPGLFVALGVIGALTFAATAVVVRESLPAEARDRGGFRATGRRLATVLRDGRFLGFAGVLALGTTLLFSYLSMSPFVLQERYGLSPQAFSYAFAATAVGMMAAGQLSAWLVGRRGAAWTLRAGLVTTAMLNAVLVTAVVLDLGRSVVLPLLTAGVSCIPLVLSTSSALALDAHRARAGTATGLMGMAQFGISGTAAPLVAIGGTTPVLMVSTMACSAALALVVGLMLIRGRVRPRGGGGPVAS